jgi:Sulfotransferase family
VTLLGIRSNQGALCVTEFSLNAIAAITDAPVFIVGAPRSGTTWVQRLLLDHPQICGGQESHFFPGFAYPMQMFDPRPMGERPVNLSTYWTKEAFFEELRGIWRRTMTPLLAAKPTATILVEKTPQHAQYMDRIIDLLPASRFIHVIRDSRAVAASLLAASRQPWGKRWAPSDALTAARVWKSHVLQACAMGASLGPQRYTTVHYEQLCADPVRHLVRLFAFIGLDVTEQWVRSTVKTHTLSNEKASATVSAEPPGFYREGSIENWRKELSFAQKRIVWKYTGPIMLQNGYTREGWKGQS